VVNPGPRRILSLRLYGPGLANPGSQVYYQIRRSLDSGYGPDRRAVMIAPYERVRAVLPPETRHHRPGAIPRSQKSGNNNARFWI
jgi:hypothetical protein